MSNKTRGNLLILFVILLFLINSYPDFKQSKELTQLFVPNYYSEGKEVKDIMRKTYSLPHKFQDILINNDIKINYVTWMINEIPEYEKIWDFNVLGVFEGSKSNILVTYKENTDHDLIGPYYLSINTFHEIGHAIDYDYVLEKDGYSYSSTPEFHSIFTEESPMLFKNIDIEGYGDYYSATRHEYFAESFAFYYASRETKEHLRMYAPKTYAYIKKISASSKQYTFLDFIKDKLRI